MALLSLPALVVSILAAIALLAFEIAMFIDVIKNPKLGNNEKILWGIGMLLLHPFVAIAYYFYARTNLKK